MNVNCFCEHVSKSLLPPPLLPMTQECLNIIDTASQYQIESAMIHNKHEINKLLIKLLTINLIATKQKQFTSNESIQFHR